MDAIDELKACVSGEGCRRSGRDAPTTESPTQNAEDVADRIAKWFHFYYESLAPSFGYETRQESAVPWRDVPEQNKALMRSVVETMIDAWIIEPGPNALIDGTGVHTDD